MANNRILGIDLNTTNSVLAVMESGDPEIIVSAEGDRTTPPIAAFTDDNGRPVGKPAENQAIQSPEHTIRSIKRRTGKNGYTVGTEGEEYTPGQISAMTPQKIKCGTKGYFGDKPQRAVITVPVYFSDKQRQATKDAGEIANLDIERIVNKPTVAPTAYGFDDESSQTVPAYDLGSGIFDVFVFDLGGGVYEVVVTGGNNDLGGDD